MKWTKKKKGFFGVLWTTNRNTQTAKPNPNIKKSNNNSIHNSKIVKYSPKMKKNYLLEICLGMSLLCVCVCWGEGFSSPVLLFEATAGFPLAVWGGRELRLCCESASSKNPECHNTGAGEWRQAGLGERWMRPPTFYTQWERFTCRWRRRLLFFYFFVCACVSRHGSRTTSGLGRKGSDSRRTVPCKTERAQMHFEKRRALFPMDDNYDLTVLVRAFKRMSAMIRGWIIQGFKPWTR